MVFRYHNSLGLSKWDIHTPWLWKKHLWDITKCSKQGHHSANAVQKIKNIIPTFLVTCADPTPRNGQVSPAGLTNRRYRINSTVSFSCDTGFYLLGDHSESTCQTTGNWDPPPPSCIGNEINDMILFVWYYIFFISENFFVFTFESISRTGFN